MGQSFSWCSLESFCCWLDQKCPGNFSVLLICFTSGYYFELRRNGKCSGEKNSCLLGISIALNSCLGQEWWGPIYPYQKQCCCVPSHHMAPSSLNFSFQKSLAFISVKWTFCYEVCVILGTFLNCRAVAAKSNIKILMLPSSHCWLKICSIWNNRICFNT